MSIMEGPIRIQDGYDDTLSVSTLTGTGKVFLTIDQDFGPDADPRFASTEFELTEDTARELIQAIHAKLYEGRRLW